MAMWQVVVLAFLVLLPFALLVDLHPSRERLSAAGRPLEREWLGPRARTSPQVGPDDDHGADHQSAFLPDSGGVDPR